MTDMKKILEEEKKKLDHEREKIIKRDNIVLYNVPENLELTHWSHQQKEDRLC